MRTVDLARARRCVSKLFKQTEHRCSVAVVFSSWFHDCGGEKWPIIHKCSWRQVDSDSSCTSRTWLFHVLSSEIHARKSVTTSTEVDLEPPIIEWKNTRSPAMYPVFLHVCGSQKQINCHFQPHATVIRLDRLILVSWKKRSVPGRTLSGSSQPCGDTAEDAKSYSLVFVKKLGTEKNLWRWCHDGRFSLFFKLP